MKEVLIVNLTRMGDLIQTTPVMAGLKDAYPDASITLIVNAGFAEICNYIPFVDRLIIMDMDYFVGGVHIGGYGLVDRYRYIEGLLNEINRVEYDTVINFTHSATSAVLLSLIKARDVKGFVADNKGHAHIKSPWLKHFFNVVSGRCYNPFHLCDIYIKASGAMPGKKGLCLNIPQDAEEMVRSKLIENGVKEGDLVVAFQPGASNKHKMWATERFAELAKRLTGALGVKVLVMGSKGEKALGEEIKRYAGNGVIDMTGNTSLLELAAFLKRCNLLVSNDSGTMHIATAVGTKVLGISLGAAYFRETGPYGKGHMVIESNVPCHPCSFHVECRDMVCRETVSVDNVYKVVEMVLNEDHKESIIEDSPAWRDVQVYESEFAEDGMLEYIPIVKRPLSKVDFFLCLYRFTWLQILDGGGDRGMAEISRRFIEKINSWYLRGDPVVFLSSINEDVSAIKILNELARNNLFKVRLIMEEAGKAIPDVDRIKDIWKDVSEIEKDIKTLGYTHTVIRPIMLYFKYGMEGLEGEDVVAMAEETCAHYDDIATHSSLMLNIIEHVSGI